MIKKDLYLELKEAYSEKNLNKLALELINLYKERKFSILRQIASLISQWVVIEISDTGKGFSKFMMLYHPDKGNFYRSIIDEHYKNGRYGELLQYSHILEIQNIEDLAATIVDYEDIDYSPVYEWDFNMNDGYQVESDDGSEEQPQKKPAPKNYDGYTFYDAIKMRQYGTLDIEFPAYYLEDLDDIELSQSNIYDLEGVEYCIHTVIMDLSSNSITDISPLWELTKLEELNLSDNQIGYIDVLSNLQQLRSIDISNNLIDDISPLFELGLLEFVNISGNPVPSSQINELEEMGVVVEK